MSTIPFRFSEKQFRRYELIIAQVVNTFPSLVVIEPKTLGLSPETIRGRLRDAITSFKQYHWESNKIDLPRFTTIHSDIVVSVNHEGKVLVGDKTTIKTTPPEPFVFVDTESTLDCTDFDSNQLTTVARLAHNKALSKRIIVSASAEQVAILQQSFDVAFIQQPDGTYLLI